MAKGRRIGDRRDGTWLRNEDPLHMITPYIMPHRADNEAFLKLKVDMTALKEYLARKNESREQDKYTIFHAVLAALVKVITLRPKMNRFVQGGRIYQRNNISLAFVVKKQFKDNAHEALAFQYFDENTTIDSLHERIMRLIHASRAEKLDHTTDAMRVFAMFPRFILRPALFLVRRLDYFGKVPKFLTDGDPNFATVFLSNLGSIGLDAAYHHLNNYGTNSVFVTIGKMHSEPFYDEEGNCTMRPALELGLTLDERIADGFYYSRTVQMLKDILEHPENLDLPAKEEVKL